MVSLLVLIFSFQVAYIQKARFLFISVSTRVQPEARRSFAGYAFS